MQSTSFPVSIPSMFFLMAQEWTDAVSEQEHRITLTMP